VVAVSLEILVTPFTPVMVAHTGPGIIGLAYHWRP
jgi:fatty acid-binding protein DegV